MISLKSLSVFFVYYLVACGTLKSPIVTMCLMLLQVLLFYLIILAILTHSESELTILEMHLVLVFVKGVLHAQMDISITATA